MKRNRNRKIKKKYVLNKLEIYKTRDQKFENRRNEFREQYNKRKKCPITENQLLEKDIKNRNFVVEYI